MVNVFVKLSNFFYGLKCKYWNKYSTVKPATLNDKEYQRKDTLISHTIFQILNDAKLQETDEDLIKIKYWWKNIFLPKGKYLIHDVFLIQMVENYNEKRFNRLINQSNSLMYDLKSNLHYIIDNMERLN